MKLFLLDKITLEISHNVEKFLSGITSNTLDKPQNAFLDFHGKIIATFGQVKVSEDRYLLVLEEKYLKSLMAHLEKFIKLSRAVVQTTDYKVYFDLEGQYKNGPEEFIIPQKHGQWILTRQALPAGVVLEEFTLFRLQHQIPLQGVDYTDDFILNIDESEFVSYTKGCFLGQEFVAKVHSRSKPSWRLTVKSEDECSEEEKNKMTSRARDPQSGKILGFVFESNR